MNKLLFRDTNLNDYIKVKLTEKGINILRKKYGSKFPINIDDEGYTKFQMWDFARIFGEHFFMTADLVCQTSVQVQVKPDDGDLLVMVEKLKEDIVEYKAEHDKQLTRARGVIEKLLENNNWAGTREEKAYAEAKDFLNMSEV